MIMLYIYLIYYKYLVGIYKMELISEKIKY